MGDTPEERDKRELEQLIGATVESVTAGYGLWTLSFSNGSTLEIVYDNDDGCDPFFTFNVRKS